MSIKLLNKFRPWKVLTSVSGRSQLDAHDTAPTSTAEAQHMMSKMREDALLRVVKDGAGKK